MIVLWTLTIIWAFTFILVIAIFFGYLLVLFILTKIRGRKPKKDKNFIPFISILIPCYNVSSVIDYKIKNTLEINYPKSKFEVIAVESGSSDDTYSKLLKYAEQKKLILIRQPKRLGKPSAINKGLERARGEIIVLTDADARVEKDAIYELVKNFADPTVGAAVADIAIITGKNIASKMNHLFYHYFRRKPRIWESELDSVSFCSGHLLAFRKSIVEKIDEDIINDDRYILLKTRSKGYRCICEPSSHAYEADTGSFLSQIKQKRRTIAGFIQGTTRFLTLLFRPRYGYFGMLILPFHFLRVVFLPFLLLLLEILSPIVIWSLLSSHGLFQVIIIFVGLISISICFLSPLRKFFHALLYGIILQVAVFAGIIDYIFKRQDPLWIRVGSPWDELAWKT